MFNFGSPPSNLIPTKTRASVSDTGLNVSRRKHSAPNEVYIPRRGLNPNTYQDPSSDDPGLGHGHGSLSLPPIAKTQSLTGTGPGSQGQGQSQCRTFSLNRFPRPPGPSRILPSPPPPAITRLPPEPKKLPTHREMLFLTLTHTKSQPARGLNFEQLSSFIRGAFEIPKTNAWESKLSKTLSNMVSKGIVIFNPGLGPLDSTYQIAEVKESNINLTVCGKSLSKVPAWPTGFTLPQGANLLCRAGPKEQPLNGFQPYSQFNSLQKRYQNDRYGRNPRNLKADPMPYMPMADPMICQSFGVRAGLVTPKSNGFGYENEEEIRPNSPNNSEVDRQDYVPDADQDPDPDDEEESSVQPDFPGGLWNPVMPQDSPSSQKEQSFQSQQIVVRRDDSRINPYMQQNKKTAPRILDTLNSYSQPHQSEHQRRNNDYQSAFVGTVANDDYRDGDLDGDDPDEEIIINHTDNLHINSCQSQETDAINRQSVSAVRRTNVSISTSSFKNTDDLPMNPMIKLKSQLPKSFKKQEPLENFDIFADYAGETREEYEINSRSCTIMNDFGSSKNESRSRISRPRIKPPPAVTIITSTTTTATASVGKDPAITGDIDVDFGGAGDSAVSNVSKLKSVMGCKSRKTEGKNVKVTENPLNFENQMDYLMGIAGIIGSYEDKPPELRKSGSRSKSKSNPSSVKTTNSINNINIGSATLKKM